MKIEIDVDELVGILVTVVIIFVVIALQSSKAEDHKHEINLRQTTNQIRYERPQSN